jgi:hypothetical protein
MKPSTIDIDGKRYAWAEIVKRRREQIKASAAPEQPALFENLHEDHRPPAERTAAGRYLNPSLFDSLVP